MMLNFGWQKKGGNAPTVLPKGSRQDRTSTAFIRNNILNVNECEIGAILGMENWRVSSDLTEWKVKGSKQSYHDWQQARTAAEGAGA